MKLVEKTIHALDKLVSHISRANRWVAMVATVAMMFYVTVSTILRYAFRSPLKGTLEVVEFMMICIVFLALAYAATQGSIIAVTLFVLKLPQRARAVLGSITCVLSVGIVGLITWEGFLRGMSMLQHWGQESGVLGIPIFPFLFVVAFGAAVLCLRLIVDFLQSLSRGGKE
jgi:TRAP-type C4-dicarboxylate transport system permease small subunit